jgi:hypothetical protein
LGYFLRRNSNNKRNFRRESVISNSYSATDLNAFARTPLPKLQVHQANAFLGGVASILLKYRRGGLWMN